MKTASNVLLALVLALACAVSAGLVVPYALQLVPAGTKPLPPLAVLMAAAAVQTGVYSFFMAWAGLHLGSKLGLGLPVVRGARAFQWKLALGVAAGLAVVIVVLDRWLFLPWQPAALLEASRRAEGGWRAWLACFYGGVCEEVFLRLFLMTTIAWVLSKVMRTERAITVALVFAALLFAAGHLPAAAKVAGLTLPVVVRVLVLNTIGGLAFGTLYRRLGLEHAMFSHFVLDVIVHGLAPL